VQLGRELTEHAASKPPMLHIIRGDATLKLGDDTCRCKLAANPARMMRLQHTYWILRKARLRLIEVKAEDRIIFSRTSRPQPSPKNSPRTWPTHEREVEERMKPILDMMSAYNLVDFRFWLEFAAVLFVATVGRETFFQQWLGSSR
jgi:hypothetical protein